jgi:hypothetical protein
MRVLLLHPEDRFSRRDHPGKWDLVVDFARAPVSAYEDWKLRTGCRVISLYDFAREVEDLYQLKQLLQAGMGSLVDATGIDWWDILFLEIAPQMQQLMLVHRLAAGLNPNCELHASRPFELATALQRLSNGPLITLESRPQAAFRTLRHYSEAFSNLSAPQLVQVLQDKFDPRHAIRRRFAFREQSSASPVVLLPSAYIGVSRMAVSYAALLPETRFLLVCARRSGELESLPQNVRRASLDSYAVPVHEFQTAELLKLWSALRQRLVRAADEFKTADAIGVLERIPWLIGWGMTLRTAWSRVFESENITGCLCADDSNPYSRIPLILAKRRGLPALACHHGALDAWMAVKTRHDDFYLAKNEMEQDYLVRTCRVAPGQILLGAPAVFHAPSMETAANLGDRTWLVFFSEAYHTAAWRTDEVYRELLPRLSTLAKACGLELVFKLHPFESIEAHRRLLRRLLPSAEVARIRIIAGAASGELWRRTRFALTGQSTVAVECTDRGVPVFLCAWLRDAYTGYVQQYARFGVGQILDSAEQISDIPGLLLSGITLPPGKHKLQPAMDPEKLQELLCGSSVCPVAGRA